MYLRILLPLLAAGVSLACAAAEQGATQVEFSGTVISPPVCQFNHGKVIEVEFNNTFTTAANGKAIKNVDYRLTCSGNAGDKALSMRVFGEEGFANDVLATSLDGLGIRLYKEGSALRLNQWFSLPKQANSMVLTAAPIFAPDSEAKTGSFQASATLMVAFQ